MNIIVNSNEFEMSIISYPISHYMIRSVFLYLFFFYLYWGVAGSLGIYARPPYATSSSIAKSTLATLATVTTTRDELHWLHCLQFLRY